jgi:hypothetical protein
MFMYKLFPVALFTLLLSLFLLSSALAVIKNPPEKERTDTSKIHVKKFDSNALNKFKADKDFNYNGESTGEPTLWDRFWSWLWDVISRLFGSIPHGGSIVKYVLLALCVTFLVYVIFKSIGIDPIKLFQGGASKINIGYSESLENIHEINFDDEVEKAISQHNYRLAVRLLYLRCLKQLSDTNLIKWEIDKTNSTYIFELTDPEKKEIFGTLTRQFEYVWYGDFAIDKQAFSNINQLFQNFKKQLS